jgi:hypothetical protein
LAEANFILKGISMSECIFEVVEGHDGPVIGPDNPGVGDNYYGFEGGRAFKLDGVYHIFTTERSLGGKQNLRTKTGLSHWKSADGINWEKVGTLMESTADVSGVDKRGVLFAPMPFFNEDEGRWNMFYVAYQIATDGKEPLHRAGRIWRAASVVDGMEGLDGPYEDIEVILEPGDESDDWEGLQGVASFYVHQAKGKWYGFFGSAWVDHKENTWWVGLAEAPKMAGPWKRCSELNPMLNISEIFAENPIVSRLPDGTYVAVFDRGHAGIFGYTKSDDGVEWSHEVPINLEEKVNKWWTFMRTPLGLIDEGDGLYTIYYTALKGEFPDACGWVGKATLKLK